MDGASFQLIFFGFVVALVSNVRRTPRWRSTVLFVASVVFLYLLAHKSLLFLPLAGFLLLGYSGVVFLERGWRRSLPWVLALTILVYIWLKKYTFLPASIFLTHPYFTLGLSYIFFRVLHLLIDAGEGENKHIGPFSYLLYTLNFTTLVSGPIQRYDDFVNDQFAPERLPLGAGIVGAQLDRLVRGFFKVNVLGVVLLALQQDALSQLLYSLPSHAKLMAALTVAAVYPFFLYANFSGYIDIVIALGRLLNLRLPENFDRPFSACSFIDFWSRWHITLSLWLKTYVYNPLLLALMRRSSAASLQPYLGVLCFFATFFLVGLWHGRTSEFICFGILQGGGVAINKLWQVWAGGALGRTRYKVLTATIIYRAFARGLTFSWFAFTMSWFWASRALIDRIFTSLGASQWIAVWLIIWISATICLQLWEWLREWLLDFNIMGVPILTSRYARVVYGSALGAASVLLVVMLNQPAPGIIYKSF